jgi:hypothetical protein
MNGRFAPFISDGSFAAAAAEEKLPADDDVSTGGQHRW